MILVELAGDGHNDALMAFFVLLALFLTIRGCTSSGLVAMSLGVLTKYVPLWLVPPQAVYLWRTRRSTLRLARGVASGAAIAVLLTAALFVPLWAGAGTLRGLWLSGRPGNTGSTQTVLIEVLSRLFPARAADPLVYGLLVAGFAAYLWTRSSSVSDVESLLRSCASVAVAYMLFVSPVYWPWYAVLPVALMAIVPTGVFLPLLVAISLGSRLVAPLDVMFDHDVIGRPAFLLVTWVGAIGLPLIVLLVWFMRSRSHRAVSRRVRSRPGQSFGATEMMFLLRGLMGRGACSRGFADAAGEVEAALAGCGHLGGTRRPSVGSRVRPIAGGNRPST